MVLRRRRSSEKSAKNDTNVCQRQQRGWRCQQVGSTLQACDDASVPNGQRRSFGVKMIREKNEKGVLGC